MRVLISGANGQVGRELQRADWPSGTHLVALGSAELDITDADAVASTVADHSPDVIVNAAAYTAVDGAEEDEQTATLVNTTGVANLADAADAAGAFLIHISTDYVFDGAKTDWYDEDDPIAPVGAYGRSKAGGEQAALAANDSVVLRTAWVYGALGSNFVTTMLRLAASRDTLGVVGDQLGCPTAAIDIARTIVELVDRHKRGPLPYRLFHVAAPDQASWHEFALAIFDASSSGFDGVCKELTTAEYPTKATRPANSRLRTDRLTELLGHSLPSWRTTLPTVVAELESP